jgi:predicted ATPase
MKIILTGAQGTGKTTVLNEFRDAGFEIVTEVVRNLAKKGVNINKDGDEKGQTKIFNEYKKIFTSNDHFISDRGLIDVVAYTVYLARHGKVSEEFANKKIKQLHKFLLANHDSYYCYFPIEFDVVADGVRDLDEEFREEISNIILSLLGALGISFVVMHGSVEERTSKLQSLIDWHNMADQLFVQVKTQEDGQD